MSSCEKLEKLIEETPPAYGNTVKIEIHSLFYNHVLLKKEFIEWLETNRERAWVEGGSEPVIRNAYRGRGGTRYLIQRGGFIFTWLFCQKRQLGGRRNDHDHADR